MITQVHTIYPNSDLLEANLQKWRRKHYNTILTAYHEYVKIMNTPKINGTPQNPKPSDFFLATSPIAGHQIIHKGVEFILAN